MKKLIIASGLIFFAIAIKAQQPHAPKAPGMEERLKRTNEILQKEVQPSPAQSAAMESVFKTFFIAADQLRKDNPPPPPPPPDPKVKTAMDQLAKERDESIKKILTEGQYKKYVVAEKSLRPPKHGEPNDPSGVPPPPQKN